MPESGEVGLPLDRRADRAIRMAEEAEQRRLDREICWLCGGPMLTIHCKIVCPRCGFRRDCSDP